MPNCQGPQLLPEPSWEDAERRGGGVAPLVPQQLGRATRETAAPEGVRIVVRANSRKDLRLDVDAIKNLGVDLRPSRRDGACSSRWPKSRSTRSASASPAPKRPPSRRTFCHLADDTRFLHGQDTAAEELRDLSTSSLTGAPKPPDAPCGSRVINGSKCSLWWRRWNDASSGRAPPGSGREKCT